MVSSKAVDFRDEHERQLQQVADECEERATKELKAALKRLREEKEAERAQALKKQKEVNKDCTLYIVILVGLNMKAF